MGKRGACGLRALFTDSMQAYTLTFMLTLKSWLFRVKAHLVCKPSDSSSSSVLSCSPGSPRPRLSDLDPGRVNFVTPFMKPIIVGSGPYFKHPPYTHLNYFPYAGLKFSLYDHGVRVRYPGFLRSGITLSPTLGLGKVAHWAHGSPSRSRGSRTRNAGGRGELPRFAIWKSHSGQQRSNLSSSLDFRNWTPPYRAA